MGAEINTSSEFGFVHCISYILSGGSYLSNFLITVTLLRI